MLPSDRTRGGVASFIARASRADSLRPHAASGPMSAIVARPIHASRIDGDSTSTPLHTDPASHAVLERFRVLIARGGIRLAPHAENTIRRRRVYAFSPRCHPDDR